MRTPGERVTRELLRNAQAEVARLRAALDEAMGGLENALAMLEWCWEQRFDYDFGQFLVELETRGLMVRQPEGHWVLAWHPLAAAPQEAP